MLARLGDGARALEQAASIHEPRARSRAYRAVAEGLLATDAVADAAVAARGNRPAAEAAVTTPGNRAAASVAPTPVVPAPAIEARRVRPRTAAPIAETVATAPRTAAPWAGRPPTPPGAPTARAIPPSPA